MGQLEEASGAGPTVFCYKAGRTLSTANTLPEMGKGQGVRSRAR